MFGCFGSRSHCHDPMLAGHVPQYKYMEPGQAYGKATIGMSPKLLSQQGPKALSSSNTAFPSRQHAVQVHCMLAFRRV